MRFGIFFIIILLFLSCNKEIDENTLVGRWHYSKELFLKEQEASSSTNVDLSDIFKTITMVFDSSEFTSYLDNQITKGQWKIQNDSLYMFLNEHGWNRYYYKYIDNNLIIYDRNFIIALERQISR